MALGITVIATSIGGVGYWAGTAPLASAVIAPGQIVVSGKRKRVQHPDGGTVRKIHVRDGDPVKAGDILVELEGSDAHLQYSLTKTAYFVSLAAQTRLVAEKEDAEEISFPQPLIETAEKDASIASVLRTERSVFTARRAERDGQVIVLRQRIAQLREEIRGHEAEQAATQNQIRIAETELELLQKLFEQGYATRTRLKALERERAELGGRAGKLSANIARTHAAIGESRLQILQLTKNSRSEILSDLSKIEEKIYDLRQRFETSSGKVDRLRIRAPVAGVVVNLTLRSAGEVIQPGATALEIVPKDDQLIVEARVRPVDVDHIKVGLDTEVRITAFNSRNMPTLQGNVTLVSADSLQDERTGEQYYISQIKVIGSDKTLAAIHRLQPGMPAEVMIKTGQRTALLYLVQPILNSLNRGMREN